MTRDAQLVRCQVVTVHLLPDLEERVEPDVAIGRREELSSSPGRHYSAMTIEAAMGQRASRNQDDTGFAYNPRFLKFIKQFATIGQDEKIFPKTCKNCGRTYRSFPEYMKATTPVHQSLEYYENIQNDPYTVQYRNCSCGSTLALAFTEENFPMIREFWAALKEEARQSGTSLAEMLDRFREQCNRYMGVDDASPYDQPLQLTQSETTD